MFRQCVYWIVVWDVLRDPVRKYLAIHPLPLAFLAGIFWLLMATPSVGRNQRNEIQSLFTDRLLVVALLCMIAFLFVGLCRGVLCGVPAGILLLGLASYSLIVPGFLVGVMLRWRSTDALRWLEFCLLVNVPFLLTGVLEAAGVRSDLLGGISMEWYRVRGDLHIPLPSGLFRSPDILGYHAATAFSIACILLLASASRQARWRYAFLATSVLFLLVLVARRKMLGFVAVFLVYGLTYLSVVYRNVPWVQHRFPSVGVQRLTLALLLATLFVGPIPQVQYAVSTLSDLPGRLSVSFWKAPATTIEQNGFWGRGLGIGTQGNYYLANKEPGVWQEDGISRLFLETGVLGAGFALAFGMVVLLAVHRAQVLLIPQLLQITDSKQDVSKIDDYSKPVVLTGLAALIVANGVTAAISHQHISGDPLTIGLVGLYAGLFFSIARSDRPLAVEAAL